jgi:hypothetical protein
VVDPDYEGLSAKWWNAAKGPHVIGIAVKRKLPHNSAVTGVSLQGPVRRNSAMAKAPKHPATEHHHQAAAYHHAAAHHHHQAAHHHDLGEHKEAKEHAEAAHEHSEQGHKYTATAREHSRK